MMVDSFVPPRRVVGITLLCILSLVVKSIWIYDTFEHHGSHGSGNVHSKNTPPGELEKSYTSRPTASTTCSEPRHVHISSASNVIRTTTKHATIWVVNMTISFSMEHNNSQCGCLPNVRYGRVGTSEDYRIPSLEPSQFSFVGPQVVKSFQKRHWSSWMHHVTLPSLVGEASYWYQLECQDNNTTRFFQTPPIPGSSTRIAVVGDWGGTAHSLKTMQSMLQSKPIPNSSEVPSNPLSAVLIAGDLSYANGHLPSWESWLEMMEPLFSTTPLLVAAGNHELECDQSTGQVFGAYEFYFSNPNRLGVAERQPVQHRWNCNNPAQFLAHYNYGNSFYALRQGNMQLIVLNSYIDTTQGSVQYQWLQQELQSIQRSVTPWIVVAFHCPFHTTFRGHNDEWNPNQMMQNMEPLFLQYRVNLAISGHQHSYLRTHSMIGKEVDESGQGPVYLTVGTGGDSHQKGPIHPKAPEAFVAHRDNTEFGFTEIHVVNETHLQVQRILNSGEAANPQAKDHVWIINSWKSDILETAS